MTMLSLYDEIDTACAFLFEICYTTSFEIKCEIVGGKTVYRVRFRAVSNDEDEAEIVFDASGDDLYDLTEKFVEFMVGIFGKSYEEYSSGLSVEEFGGEVGGQD